MRRFQCALLATIAAVVFTSIASAADMPVKAPVYKAPAAVAPPSWTGFYLGAELGGEWANSRWATTSLATPPLTLVIDASSPRDFHPASLRAGGYVGYNWQFAPQWVGGVEFDIAWADKTVTAAGVPGCTISCSVGAPGPGIDQSSVRIRWDASARARLGFLATPDILIYGTGGIAWQNFEVSATCQHSTPDPLCFFFAGTPVSTVTDAFTRVGWTLGGGIDSRVSRNWIARAEYRYADFGTKSGTLDLSLPRATTTVGYQLKSSAHIATLGLAYRFGN